MFKKTLLIVLSCVFVLTFSACSKAQNKDSVFVKESDDSVDYRLDEAKLLNPVEFSNDDILVTFEDILYEDLVTWFTFNIQNDSEMPLNVLVTDFSVNGVMYQDSMLSGIDPKNTKTVYFEISNDWFFDFFIKTIKELEFTVRILDENSNEIASSDVLKATPDAPKKYVQQYDKSGTPVFEKDGALILSQGINKSKMSDDSELVFYIENNTDSHFSVIAEEVYVNENLFSPAFIVSVGANKKATESMLFTKEELKGTKIEKIFSVKASFRAIDKKSNIVFKTDLLDIPLK